MQSSPVFLAVTLLALTQGVVATPIENRAAKYNLVTVIVTKTLATYKASRNEVSTSTLLSTTTSYSSTKGRLENLQERNSLTIVLKRKWQEKDCFDDNYYYSSCNFLKRRPNNSCYHYGRHCAKATAVSAT